MIPLAPAPVSKANFLLSSWICTASLAWHVSANKGPMDQKSLCPDKDLQEQVKMAENYFRHVYNWCRMWCNIYIMRCEMWQMWQMWRCRLCRMVIIDLRLLWLCTCGLTMFLSKSSPSPTVSAVLCRTLLFISVDPISGDTTYHFWSFFMLICPLTFTTLNFMFFQQFLTPLNKPYIVGLFYIVTHSLFLCLFVLFIIFLSFLSLPSLRLWLTRRG